MGDSPSVPLSLFLRLTSTDPTPNPNPRPPYTSLPPTFKGRMSTRFSRTSPTLCRSRATCWTASKAISQPPTTESTAVLGNSHTPHATRCEISPKVTALSVAPYCPCLLAWHGQRLPMLHSYTVTDLHLRWTRQRSRAHSYYALLCSCSSPYCAICLRR